MQPIDLQAFTYEERFGLLPALTSTVSMCGAWILDRKTISPTALELRLEIQLRFIVELYAALVAAGVELTRDGHQALGDLCTCRKHFATDSAQVVTIRIGLTFLEDMTLHSILMAQASAA
jgi:hypothetical protein